MAYGEGMNVKALLANPLVKALATNVAGAAAYTIVSAVDHPTGGTAAAISASPAAAAAYLIVQQTVHNLVSKYASYPTALGK